ncbi:hypothetical protein [Haliangium sp.]|uniref:hypothetical protein n=1 Tax=Haliangium sp. TaxID=2663208 RepID=UPI003D143AD3
MPNSSILPWILLAALPACAEVEPSAVDGGAWRPLIDAAMWEETPTARDPLAEHRATTVPCDHDAWRVEGAGLEVETTSCGYLSLDQPLVEQVLAGDLVRVNVWWQTLASEAPALGHLAVLIDGEVVWEEHVDIPGEADARLVEVRAERDFAPGATITFHLHNHGYNTWNLGAIEVSR